MALVLSSCFSRPLSQAGKLPEWRVENTDTVKFCGKVTKPNGKYSQQSHFVGKYEGNVRNLTANIPNKVALLGNAAGLFGNLVTMFPRLTTRLCIPITTLHKTAAGLRNITLATRDTRSGPLTERFFST
jgi:hypothetical protein